MHNDIVVIIERMSVSSLCLYSINTTSVCLLHFEFAANTFHLSLSISNTRRPSFAYNQHPLPPLSVFNQSPVSLSLFNKYSYQFVYILLLHLPFCYCSTSKFSLKHPTTVCLYSTPAVRCALQQTWHTHMHQCLQKHGKLYVHVCSYMSA